MDISALNAEHGIPGHLHFVEGRGGLVMLEIDNALARATITPYGGQVLRFRPKDADDDLLFVSSRAYFTPGKENKGGVPLCWPWFGVDPDQKGRLIHGFIRCLTWNVLACEALDDGRTRVRLGVSDDEGTRAIWPYYFNAWIEIVVGATLSVSLLSRNAGDDPMRITQGLHTYFNVGDAARIQVLGLDGCAYIDKARGAGDARLRQRGAVTVEAEVNRIYEDVPARLAIQDPVLGRRIRIAAEHSKTCVVWNPWTEVCREMDDLGDDDFRRFVCVETVNAASEVVELLPGQSSGIGAEYSIERL